MIQTLLQITLFNKLQVRKEIENYKRIKEIPKLNLHIPNLSNHLILYLQNKQ
jgi:hypothetical protein